MQKMGVGSSTWRLLIVSQNPLEWLSSNKAKHKWPKEFQCNGCDIKIQFG